MIILPYYFLAVFQLYLSWRSLHGGIEYLRYFRQYRGAAGTDGLPFATVIAPCKGIETGLEDNLAALAAQDYPEYEIVFVVDSEDDPAVPVIQQVREKAGMSSLVVAGRAVDSGQKVHNLIRATGEVSDRSEVLVFVDSDARPSKDWLAELVSAAVSSPSGCASGYRWFFPEKGGLASHLRSVWNASIASALGPDERANFCWGGSTAITRMEFDRLNVREGWRGKLSDDFALTEMVKNNGGGIRFVPPCLTASVEDCGLREMLEFTTRQMKITRVYRPDLWALSFTGSVVFLMTLAASAAVIVYGSRLNAIVASLVLLFVTLAGVTKAHLRLKAVAEVLPDEIGRLKKQFFPQLTLWVITPFVFLWNDFAALFSRRIVWRGVEYELRSPSSTVIIDRNG